MKSQSTPRRRRKSPAARLRPFWILLVLLFVVAAMATYGFVTWPALKAHTILVAGNHITTKEQILNAAHVNLNANIWLQNTKAMAARVEAIPYIDTASVHRRPPGTIAIDVTERKPFALLQSGADRVVVDRTLRVLQPDDGGFGNLPVFVASASAPQPGQTLKDEALVSLRDDEEALAAAGIAPASLSHDKYGDLVIMLHDGIRVLLGDESDLAKKIPLIEPILTQVGKAGRPISTIDLRAPGTPVVVYKK